MILTKKIATKEKNVHQAVADYLKLQYPKVIFLSDASGMRVSIGLRMELKRKRCVHYKIPDMIILHPAKGFHGLILEIKKSYSDWFTKNGAVKTNDPHIYDQWKALDALDRLGYKTNVGCGFDKCKEIIDSYLT